MLWHITTGEAWRRAITVGHLLADSLESEGFIHCSALHQVIGTANLLFGSTSGLVLVGIDAGRLDVAVAWEDLYGSGQEFPHVYGPVPVEAVVKVLDFPCGPDGTFTLPQAI